MKKVQSAALCVATLGIIAWLAGQKLTYAASAEAQSAQAIAGAEQAGQHPVNREDEQAYASHCAICHGEQREGSPPAIPSLLGVTRKYNDGQITEIIHHGRGRMPAFPKVENQELSAVLRFLATTPLTPAAAPTVAPAEKVAAVAPSPAAEAGGRLFQQNCAFCHGRDAGGGESGPDLTRSQLVTDDVGGNKIMEVIHNGRPEKRMPAFNFSDPQMLSLVAFIHSQQAKAIAMNGKRRGVDVSDLQTGDVEAGRRYFNGAGTCAKCHSPTGDLARIASRYRGLQLEQRMLYPRDAKSRVSVTDGSGRTIAGTLAYVDEFTVALRDGDGSYHSWPVNRVKYVLDAPVEAHAELFSKYTDADIHNLMAYIQTLR